MPDQASGLEIDHSAEPGTRQVPDFIVIGAMRCGSTSLTNFLRRQPTVTMADVKELHFFDRNYHRGFDWYKAQFRPSQGVVTGEATPNYLYKAEVPHRIRSLVPNAKLVVILRDPVARAYSHYWHRVARGGEPLSFDDAVRLEDARSAQMSHRQFDLVTYVHRGRYGEQLQRYYALFPMAQIRVVVLEEVDEDPTAHLGRLVSWLHDSGGPTSINAADWPRCDNRYMALRSTLLRQATRRAPRWVRRMVAVPNAIRESSYPPVDDSSRTYVLEQLAEDRERLERLLGRRIECWPRA